MRVAMSLTIYRSVRHAQGSIWRHYLSADGCLKRLILKKHNVQVRYSIMTPEISLTVPGMMYNWPWEQILL